MQGWLVAAIAGTHLVGGAAEAFLCGGVFATPTAGCFAGSAYADEFDYPHATVKCTFRVEVDKDGLINVKGGGRCEDFHCTGKTMAEVEKRCSYGSSGLRLMETGYCLGDLTAIAHCGRDDQFELAAHIWSVHGGFDWDYPRIILRRVSCSVDGSELVV
mmetsp:Transcript_44428/g.102681  ORF Transcript_44428/g.102681 Transcript_44428/m.102681 type:complete len:159 (-) Transcript_44428:80-556(-)